jgi:hypothetical protein
VRLYCCAESNYFGGPLGLEIETLFFPFLAVSDDVRVSFLSGYAILCTLND